MSKQQVLQAQTYKEIPASEEPAVEGIEIVQHTRLSDMRICRGQCNRLSDMLNNEYCRRVLDLLYVNMLLRADEACVSGVAEAEIHVSLRHRASLTYGNRRILTTASLRRVRPEWINATTYKRDCLLRR